MIRYSRRPRILAICLAMLAGFIDAIGFLKLGGLFVSFMSGNSTRLAVGIATQSHPVLLAASLIGAFVGGVIVGSLLSTLHARRRKATVLLTVSVLLALAAGCNRVALDGWAVHAMAVAMGCANTVFQRDGEVSVGVTYMTGTLVKVGQRIADALLGGNRLGWLPYLLLWLGLVLGGVAGAIGYHHIGMNGLWVGAAFAMLLSLLAPQTPSEVEKA
ncbi:YoaK family protein [Sphingobium sp. D43FB]|uniref:YoaK family protein n=1 Tax=Sphingobium sp. D43FB TaxID=2017595 RepID=UPI000BB54081|nr:YoaK family protein [Sphingobium sp. D43FB]PBN43597.1 hypothetical protein SxD43FB_10895 [Sphingobium sp. D43FB]